MNHGDEVVASSKDPLQEDLCVQQSTKYKDKNLFQTMIE